MLLSETIFPRGSVIAITETDSGLRVRVYYNSRNKDALVRRSVITPEEREKQMQDKEDRIRVNILELVGKQPNRSFSHYTRLPMAEGGFAGSQEMKERVLRGLISAGRVVQVELDKPMGRIKHVYRLADVVSD